MYFMYFKHFFNDGVRPTTNSIACVSEGAEAPCEQETTKERPNNTDSSQRQQYLAHPSEVKALSSRLKIKVHPSTRIAVWLYEMSPSFFGKKGTTSQPST